jgi:hypothetical protein
MSADRRRRAGYLVLSFAALAAIAAIWAAVTGGFRIHFFGIPVSARGEHRAALVALVLGLTGYAILDRERVLTRSLGRSLRHAAIQLHAWTVRRAASLLAVVVLVAATTVFWVGVRHGVRSAGGADSSGYVSQSVLWREGSLRQPLEIARVAPWPHAGWTFAPLGYKPGAGDTLVPVYAPGLPLLMAGAEMVAGSCGPYYVGPLCAAILVWFTYVLGVRLAGDAPGTMAALAIAASPTMLFMSMSAMSDVPAAAFWTASLALATGRGPATIASGAAAGIAIMIRPNLAPLALFPMLLAVWPSLKAGRAAVVRPAILFAVACAPGPLLVGWVFNHLYGSPFESGYGPSAALYKIEYFAANIVRYPRWLWDTQTPIAYLFVLTPLFIWRRPERRGPLAWVLLAFTGATFAAYLFYEPFNAWWFLRFLLPAFAPILVLSFAVVWWTTARWPRWIRGVAAVALTLFVVHDGIRLTREFGIMFLREGEQKYADAGKYLARELPLNAVVVSMLHSGSVHLYSGRPILRYDLMAPHWIDEALDHLRRQGYAPYLLLEDWEATTFRERFASQKIVALVDAAPIAARPDGHVLLFRGDAAEPPAAPAAVIPASSTCGIRD